MTHFSRPIFTPALTVTPAKAGAPLLQAYASLTGAALNAAKRPLRGGLIARISTVLFLLLASSGAGAAQVIAPETGQNGDPDIEAGIPGPPTGLAPPAPPATTQLGASDRLDVLLGAARHIRQRIAGFITMAGGDSVAVDPRYHPSPFPWGVNAGQPPVAISPRELELLLRELRGVASPHENFETNCRPLVGCELTFHHVLILGEPVLRADGTVTITFEHRFRILNYRRPSGFAAFEIVLSRKDGSWAVTRTSAAAMS